MPNVQESFTKGRGVPGWLRQSLARRMTVMVTVLLVAVGAGICAASYLEVRRAARQVAESRMEQVGLQLSGLLARSPAEVGAKLRRLADDPVLASALATGDEGALAEARAVLRGAAQSEPRGPLLLLAGDGTLLFESSQPEWFGPPPVPGTTPAADTGYQVGPHTRLVDSLLYYDIRTPIRGSDRPIGAVIQRGRLNVSSQARETFAWLLGGGLSVVIGSPASGTWTDLGDLLPPPPANVVAAAAPLHTLWDRTSYLISPHGVEGTPWMVLVRVPEGMVMEPARTFLGRAVLMAGVLVLLGAVGAAAIGHRLSRPIRDLTEVTEAIAAGDYSRRANGGSTGELARLGNSFNAMVTRVGEFTQRLQENEQNLRAFVAHSSEGIWRLDLGAGIDVTLSPEDQLSALHEARGLLRANQALLAMYGVETGQELAELPFARVFPPDDPHARNVLRGFLTAGYRTSRAETREAPESGATRVYLNDLLGIVEDGRLRAIWGTRRDVTVERLIDERIAQTQRLESIGRVAGGVAHDFNNLLTAILGNAELLLTRLPEGDARRGGAKEIIDAVLRATDLGRQLLAFSRGQVLEPKVVDLNGVLHAMRAIVRRVIPEDVDLRFRLAEGLHPVEVDTGQIERVLMNLVANARDAMPNGGLLELRTANVTIDGVQAGRRPGLRPGRFVELAVSDTGVGMPEEVRLRIFEPFFSTKPPGEGNGLGLATVYGIVRQSGGDISVYSEPGHGSVFRILLPARPGAVPEGIPDLVPGASARPRGVGRILLVEDERAVRQVARMALEDAGYAVVEAADGHAALALARAESGPIDLLLTDMVMPGMGGRELAAALHLFRPGLRVIVMSGYSGDTHPAAAKSVPGEHYLGKPFSVTDLLRTVRSALET